jgi:hypothetical protein
MNKPYRPLSLTEKRRRKKWNLKDIVENYGKSTQQTKAKKNNV